MRQQQQQQIHHHQQHQYMHTSNNHNHSRSRSSKRRVLLIPALAVFLLLHSIPQTNATGYKPDPTHRYEHIQDIEKLLHPNQEIHLVQCPDQQQQQQQQRRLTLSGRDVIHSHFSKGGVDDDVDHGDNYNEHYHPGTDGGLGCVEPKALNTGLKRGYNHDNTNIRWKGGSMPFVRSMVTNIVDVSAVVERESVLTWDGHHGHKSSDDVTKNH